MFTRYLTSAAVAFSVTCALLLTMHFLIGISEATYREPGPRHTLKWIKVIKDTDTRKQELLPVQIDDPVSPPINQPPVNDSNSKAGIRVESYFPASPASELVIPELGVSNNALFNIITVQPVYPAAAARSGHEGTVVVQFDVAASGAVINVAVIGTSNRIFNKAAIDAAYKFRYKARVVDGTPVATHSVRKLFRFEMDNS